MSAVNVNSVKDIISYVFLSPLRLPPPPPAPILNIPTWTHIFNADTNSSNRVRAAAVAFLAPQDDGILSRSRLLHIIAKKKAKQEKFLKMFDEDTDCSTWLNLLDIKNDVIVFDGTASHPPPPIYPPPQREYYFISQWCVSTYLMVLYLILQLGWRCIKVLDGEFMSVFDVDNPRIGISVREKSVFHSIIRLP